MKRQDFVTVYDIETAAGYPFRFPNKLHCRTLLVFTYRKDTELCSAVKSAPRSGHERARREVIGYQEAEVSLDDDQYVMDRSIVDEIVDYRT